MRDAFLEPPGSPGVAAARGRITVLGIGNPARGDDGAGRVVAHRLAGRCPGVVIRELDGEATEVLEAMEGFDTAVLIDAARSGAAPGEIHRLRADVQHLPGGFGPRSTHSFGVAAAIELARTLERLPDIVVVYGIEVGSVSFATGLTPAVSRAVETIAAEIAEQLTRHAGAVG